MFDDVSVVDVDIHTTPTESPADVIATRVLAQDCWGDCDEPADWAPDPIWSQCDIQFRMVKYKECVVDPELFENKNTDDQNGCPTNPWGLNGWENKLRDAAVACAGLPKQGQRTIIYFGDYVNRALGCAPEQSPLASEDGGYVFMTRSAHGHVLAHELGHAVGLAADLEGSAYLDNLMHVSTYPTSDATNLTSAQCDQARAAVAASTPQ